MARDRQPTPEEKRLWRTVTQHDQKYREDAALDGEDDLLNEPLSPLPPIVHEPPPLRPPTRSPVILNVLGGREAARLLKPYAPIEATLDLHGIGRVEAYTKVSDFLTRARNTGLRHVLIITGKGRSGEGILRTQLPQWLNEPALRILIVGIAHPPANKGGSGVLHVVLRRAQRL